jgi:hypothetical protein
MKERANDRDNMQDEIYNFYSQSGGSMQVFAGARRPGMVGGGFFSTLARFALPILKSIGGRVLRVAARTARDVVGNHRNLGESLLQNASREMMRSSPVNKQQG